MNHFLRMSKFAFLATTILIAAARGQAVDPLVGAWELNVSKSTYHPGPGPKSQMRTIEAYGEGLKYTAKGIDAQGNPTLISYTANDDGKEYPVSGSQFADTISFKRVDGFTREFTQKRAGKVIATGRLAVSKDGTTLTITHQGTNLKGQAFHDVSVFEQR